MFKQRSILLICLSLLLTLALIPTTAGAEDASGTYSNGVSWSLHDTAFTVSGTGDIPDYSKTNPVPYTGFSYNSVTQIVICDGITGIGNNAFYGFGGVANVTIPNGVTRIGDNAFGGCTSLSSITIPSSVNEICPDAFYLDEKLATINYSGTQAQWDALVASGTIPSTANVICTGTSDPANTSGNNNGNTNGNNSSNNSTDAQLDLTAVYDKKQKTVTVTLKTASSITLSNYDAILRWETEYFNLKEISNGQTKDNAIFESNMNSSSSKYGSFSWIAGGSDVTLASGQVLATFSFEVKSTITDLNTGNYSFQVELLNAAQADEQTLAISGQTFSASFLTVKLSTSSFDNATGGLAKVAFTNLTDGDFTVTCSSPCAVMCKIGDSYQLIQATAVSGKTNTYKYTLPEAYTGETPLVICLKGDFNADGTINSTDALQVLRACVNSITATDIQILTSNLDTVSGLSSTDARQILKLTVGTASASW